MSSPRDRFENPLTDRYASAEMSRLFSPDTKFRTWRQLWIALAETEKELGLEISDSQLDAMRATAEDINYAAAEAREKETRHDVMSHVHAWGLQCPEAAGIIHLGATSCYVGDNTDLIQMRGGLQLMQRRMLAVIRALATFCSTWADTPTLGYTHFQPAQPTTVGKRASLWLQDLLMDFEDLEQRLSTLRFLGSKGTTGTQASFLTLFEGSDEKVRQLDERVSRKMGFDKIWRVTGQTYPRKEDARVMDWLAGLGRSAHRITNDLRLLQHMKEIEEPFEKNQIGSSAMAYKRNPMRSERASSLAKLLMALPAGPGMTAATQWFERTLDDSALKRIAVPEAFLAADAILLILKNLFDGLVVYTGVIQKHLMAELPFMATETVLMEAVKRGGDRQRLHEVIRKHSMATARKVKEDGGENDLLERLSADPNIPFSMTDLTVMMNPRAFTGRAGNQVREFLAAEVQPLLDRYHTLLDDSAVDLRV